jgi:predicted secreted protein
MFVIGVALREAVTVDQSAEKVEVTYAPLAGRWRRGCGGAPKRVS